MGVRAGGADPGPQRQRGKGADPGPGAVCQQGAAELRQGRSLRCNELAPGSAPVPVWLWVRSAFPTRAGVVIAERTSEKNVCSPQDTSKHRARVSTC